MQHEQNERADVQGTKKRFSRQALTALFQSQKRGLVIAAAVFGSSLLAWLVMAILDMGTRAREDLWYGAGSPILPQQVLLCLLFTAVLFFYEEQIVAGLTKFTRGKLSPDLVIFLLVWAATAFLWARQSTPSGFTAPRPLPPNNELYPFADALRYDLGGQFALIGQGFNNGRFYYRVFYEGLLFLFHLVVGQRYESVMSLQAALFAIFPATVYLLGKSLKNRSLGIFSALAATFAGLNSIAASEWVDVANPKQMLTDFPTAVGVAGFTLLVVLWIRRPERSSLLFWAAGVIGATALVRTSALGLLPLLILAIWFFLRRTWKEKTLLSILAVIVFLASAIPWSSVHGRFVTDMYSTKILSVVGLRYDVLEWREDAHFEPRPRPQTPPLVAMTNHFAHNLVASVLILPTSPVFSDLESLVREKTPYWNPQWDGALDLVSKSLIALNLLLLALGVGAAFQSAGWRGLVPLAVYFGYAAVNSVGRTSGGRYSAPMDWIVLFYFAWGALVLLGWAKAALSSAREAREEGPAQSDMQAVSARGMIRQSFLPFLVLFGVSALTLALSMVMPKRYSSQVDLYKEFTEKGYNLKAGIDAVELPDFLTENGSVFLSGRALYPRYYLAGQGIDAQRSAFEARDYPRLVFSLVGAQDHLFVILPGAPPKNFPNASDVIVLGCRAPDSDTIEAVAVVVFAEKTYVYAVPPSVALHCPLELKSGATQ
jgi:hypothetical protein